MMKWKYNAKARETDAAADVSFLGMAEAAKAHRFLQNFDNYSVTPLRSLAELASKLGIGGLYIKDESYRFGLNAFKVLGGAYAIGRYLAQRLETDIEELSFDKLKSTETRARLGDITFITATDGNHGRGVAWAAQQLGQKAVVYMPKGSSSSRKDAITATGAECYITEWNYDECVRVSAKLAEENGWVVVQDTAWEGYAEIPEWIMQGYSVLSSEIMEQLRDCGIEKPTHLFLQAGVGSFAGAVLGQYAAAFGPERPITTIVEPNKADCLYKSAEAGKWQAVTGEMDTIMAGLACGEPNPVAWDILNSYAEMFISCPDDIAATGMRILGNPLAGDPAVISGESGAVTTGLVSAIMLEEGLAEVKRLLKLDEQSIVLVISTEGDTDPTHYRRVVWEGLHAKPIIR
jgi:diaminopropionate ammonia-lyase